MSSWLWACLSCNRTWDKTSPAAHRCDHPLEVLEQLRAFWTAILRWSPPLRGKTDDQIRKLITRPIARAQLVALLGPSWDPAGDDCSRMPTHKPREAAA